MLIACSSRPRPDLHARQRFINTDGSAAIGGEPETTLNESVEGYCIWVMIDWVGFELCYFAAMTDSAQIFQKPGLCAVIAKRSRESNMERTRMSSRERVERQKREELGKFMKWRHLKADRGARNSRVKHGSTETGAMGIEDGAEHASGKSGEKSKTDAGSDDLDEIDFQRFSP